MLFIFVQVYVLDKIPHLHRFIVPYIYYLFILWLPHSTPRLMLLVIGFFTGLSLDYFKMTPGLHASVCVLIAYVRPFIITLFIFVHVYVVGKKPHLEGFGYTHDIEANDAVIKIHCFIYIPHVQMYMPNARLRRN